MCGKFFVLCCSAPPALRPIRMAVGDGGVGRREGLVGEPSCKLKNAKCKMQIVRRSWPAPGKRVVISAATLARGRGLQPEEGSQARSVGRRETRYRRFLEPKE